MATGMSGVEVMSGTPRNFLLLMLSYLSCASLRSTFENRPLVRTPSGLSHNRDNYQASPTACSTHCTYIHIRTPKTPDSVCILDLLGTTNPVPVAGPAPWPAWLIG